MALEILLSVAELIIEGERDLDQRTPSEGPERGYATVMLSIDLCNCAELLRERADEASAERVAELMRGNRSVRSRVIELARPQLAALFAAEARSMRIELVPVVRTSGTRILLDGDAVVSLGSRARPRAGGQS